MTKNQTITVSVEVKNIGARSGKEVVMLYLSDDYASITPEVKALKRFEKIDLAPNQSQIVTFELTQSDLQFVNNNLKWIAEPGSFTIRIANQSSKFELVGR